MAAKGSNLAKQSAVKPPLPKSLAYTPADNGTRVRTWIDTERAKGTNIKLLSPGRREVELELSKPEKAVKK